MKIWITKYALTKGIIEAECEYESCDGYLTACFRDKNGNREKIFLTPRDYEKNEKDAIYKSEKMRIKKINNLHKQILRLEKMKFG